MHVSILGSRRVPSSHGGFETFTQDFAFFLLSRGHQVTVLTTTLAIAGKLKTRRLLLQPHRIPPPKESMRPMAAKHRVTFRILFKDGRPGAAAGVTRGQ
jgi:hypothetical protein